MLMQGLQISLRGISHGVSLLQYAIQKLYHQSKIMYIILDMRINSGKTPSLAKASQHWIAAQSTLSPSSVSAYSGEVNRFGEHLAGQGVIDVKQITEALWVGYLQSLVTMRQSVSSRRTNALKGSSALQAARITRGFLRHCWLQGWIEWLPGVGSRRCEPNTGKPVVRQVPQGLLAVLLDNGSSDDELLARARCALGIAFWCGLKPWEIALLKESHFVRVDSCSEIRAPQGSERLLVPDQLAGQLDHYLSLRRVGRENNIGDDLPLISRIGSHLPLTPNTVWELLRCWPPAATGEEEEMHILGSKAVRDSFVVLACEDAISAVEATRRQANRRRIVLDPFDANSEPLPAKTLTDAVLQRIKDQLPLNEQTNGFHTKVLAS